MDMENLPRPLVILINSIFDEYEQFNWNSAYFGDKMRVSLVWTRGKSAKKNNQTKHKSRSNKERDINRMRMWKEKKELNDDQSSWCTTEGESDEEYSEMIIETANEHEICKNQASNPDWNPIQVNVLPIDTTATCTKKDNSNAKGRENLDIQCVKPKIKSKENLDIRCPKSTVKSKENLEYTEFKLTNKPKENVNSSISATNNKQTTKRKENIDNICDLSNKRSKENVNNAKGKLSKGSKENLNKVDEMECSDGDKSPIAPKTIITGKSPCFDTHFEKVVFNRMDDKNQIIGKVKMKFIIVVYDMDRKTITHLCKDKMENTDDYDTFAQYLRRFWDIRKSEDEQINRQITKIPVLERYAEKHRLCPWCFEYE